MSIRRMSLFGAWGGCVKCVCVCVCRATEKPLRTTTGNRGKNKHGWFCSRRLTWWGWTCPPCKPASGIQTCGARLHRDLYGANHIKRLQTLVNASQKYRKCNVLCFGAVVEKEVETTWMHVCSQHLLCFQHETVEGYRRYFNQIVGWDLLRLSLCLLQTRRRAFRRSRFSCWPQVFRCGGPRSSRHSGAGDQSVHGWTLEHGLVQDHCCAAHALCRPSHMHEHAFGGWLESLLRVNRGGCLTIQRLIHTDPPPDSLITFLLAERSLNSSRLWFWCFNENQPARLSRRVPDCWSVRWKWPGGLC